MHGVISSRSSNNYSAEFNCGVATLRGDCSNAAVRECAILIAGNIQSAVQTFLYASL